MAEPYSYEEGNDTEIICVDKESLDSEIGKVNFELSLKKENYQDETRILDYIKRILNNYNDIHENWKDIDISTDNFAKIAEEVPEPNSPDGLEDTFEDESSQDVQGQQEEYYRVNTPQGGNLNVRSGAGTNSQVKTSIPTGTELKVKGYEGNWAKVEYKDANGNIQEGYVYKEYISNSNTGSSTGESSSDLGESSGGSNFTGTSSQSLGSYTVNTPQGGNLNLRGGPSTKSGVYTSVPNNTELKVTGWSEDGKWAHVTYQVGDTTKDGYVWSEYLKEQK